MFTAVYGTKEEAGVRRHRLHKIRTVEAVAESKNLLFTRWELVSSTLGIPMMLVGPAHHARESLP
jgi:hypothetical protein